MIVLDEETHVYSDDATGVVYPSVTQIISAAGLMGAWVPDEWYMERGKAVHLACELYDRDDLEETSVDPAIMGCLQAWIRFRDETGYVPTEIEQIRYNPMYGYCGTVDRGDLDIKSGVPMKHHILQAAAYWKMSDANAFKTPWRTVYLKDDGSYTVKVYKPQELMEAFKVFAAAMTVANWKRENKA